MKYEYEEKERKKIEYTWSDAQLREANEEYLKIKETDSVLRHLKWLAQRNAIVINNHKTRTFSAIYENYGPMVDLLEKALNKYGKKVPKRAEIESLEKVAEENMIVDT